jgi:hypothetical protein
MSKEKKALQDLFKDLEKVESFINELTSLDVDKLGENVKKLTEEFDEIEDLKEKFENKLEKMNKDNLDTEK